ncbi:MAG: E3 ubiquitin-protein ligase hrd1 [Trizodia sp. TS-e1964]|nr:MAG: E3 ubiquitin-protein ligase hrd1 [Trizodia sp. TS-e1964]
MRLAVYAGTSTALAAGVILHAFYKRANFYSACVHLAQSYACLMILTNLLLLGVCLLMLLLQRLFYGPLRPIEVEQLYEKAWFAIMETCLAMTIFREEVGGWFLVMFVSLLVGKVWGWIGEGRVEVLEQQPPANPRLFHARLSLSLFISLLFDISILGYSVKTVLRMAQPNMMVMFAFEFAILAILSSSTAARYALSLTEAYITRKQVRERLSELREERREAQSEQIPIADGDITASEIDETDIDAPGWDGKGKWIFYLDLATDFLKLVVYLSFFTILLTFYGLPIHIMRDLFLTLRSFVKRIVDFYRFRRATKDMNKRYLDATAEEIARENTCIICREEMRPWQANDTLAAPGPRPALDSGTRRAASSRDERARSKKLPCGHILHFGCLRSWLERQQNCPTCRQPVLARAPTRPDTTNPPDARGAAQGRQLEWPAQGRNGGARIVNIGPLRIGFGIGGGNLAQDLAHQLHNGQAPPAAAVPPINQNGIRQFGFGLGLGHANPTAPAAAPGYMAAMAQLGQAGPAGSMSSHAMQTLFLQIEQSINRELHLLALGTAQLHAVRLLQAELARLRQVQGMVRAGLVIPQAQPTAEAPPGPAAHPPLQLAQQGMPALWNAQHQPPGTLEETQLHFANPALPPMTTGHPGLPSGMVVPPGWTVLPLQRVENTAPAVAAGHAPSSTHAGAAGVENVGGNRQQMPLGGRPECLQQHRTGNVPAAPASAAAAKPSGAAGSSSGLRGGPRPVEQAEMAGVGGDGRPGEASQDRGKGRAATVEDEQEESGG